MTKKEKKATGRSTSKDPVTSYARAVVKKRIIAGPHVRDACARHLKDLEEGAARGLVWDIETANRAIGYFRDVLRLNGGEFEGKPFILIDWECFVVGSIFGWKASDGYRRFRIAYVETGKGSGKSPVAAGIGIYGLTADGEPRAEIYAAATKKEQAMILFRDAVVMRDQSPDLASRLTKSGVAENAWNLAYPAQGGFFRPIAADDSQSGPRPHIALLDEIHEHRNGTVIEMMRAGTKSRRQALMFMITNSGTNKLTVCGEYHDYAVEVASGQRVDDSFFAYVCALDEGDDPFKDERCWGKANPSLKHGLPGLKYLREQVVQARGMPSKESLVRRLNFCEWVDAETPWLPKEAWFGCEDRDFDPDLLVGRRCYGGLDLSSTQDLTALDLEFEPTDDDPYWRSLTYFWMPADGLREKADRDRVPYMEWKAAGFLEALPGRAINKLAVIRRLAEITSRYELVHVAYDRWRIEDLKMLMEQEGVDIPMVPFGQGYKDMAPAIDEFEQRLINQRLRHFGNPVQTRCAANAVVVSDPAGNRKVSKERAIARVDGIVAAVMATGASCLQTQEAAAPEIIIL